MKLFSTDRVCAYDATLSDIDKIIEIAGDVDNRNYIFAQTKEEYIELLSEENLYLITFKLKDRDEIIGFLIMKFDTVSNSLELRRIAISIKGEGLGKEIIEGIKKYSFEVLKAHRLWLDVYTFNHRAIAIYEKLNFKREGTLRDAYRDERGYHTQHVYSILEDEYREES